MKSVAAAIKRIRERMNRIAGAVVDIPEIVLSKSLDYTIAAMAAKPEWLDVTTYSSAFPQRVMTGPIQYRVSISFHVADGPGRTTADLLQKFFMERTKFNLRLDDSNFKETLQGCILTDLRMDYATWGGGSNKITVEIFVRGS